MEIYGQMVKIQEYVIEDTTKWKFLLKNIYSIFKIINAVFFKPYLQLKNTSEL